MAFKLNKTEIDTRNKIADNMEAAYSDLLTEIEEYNDIVEAAWEKLAARIAEYNELIVQAKEFVSNVAQEQQELFEDKSERWQGSDAGQEAENFIQAWENIEFEEIEVDEPKRFELENVEYFYELRDLPDSSD